MVKIFIYNNYYATRILDPVHKISQYTKKLLYKFGPVALGWCLPAKNNTGAMMGLESGAEIYLSIIFACRLLLELCSVLFCMFACAT